MRRIMLAKYHNHVRYYSDLKKKISLRDERIASLEMANRIAATTLRQQTDNHIAELSSLREQLQVCIVIVISHTYLVYINVIIFCLRLSVKMGVVGENHWC
jgi:hypothetical protein